MLIGDDSALPAIETILEALPAHAQAIVLIEVPDAREVRPVQGPAGMDLRWLLRGDDAEQAGRTLEAAVRELGPLPSGQGRVYIGCEAAAMRRLRATLAHTPGVERGTIVARGYWKLGNTNHPDHDFADEAD